MSSITCESPLKPISGIATVILQVRGDLSLVLVPNLRTCMYERCLFVACLDMFFILLHALGQVRQCNLSLVLYVPSCASNLLP